MKPSACIALSTTFRRSTARLGLPNGDRDAGLWMVPAISAASATLMLATSLPKKMRAASATPWMANEPRWPR